MTGELRENASIVRAAKAARKKLDEDAEFEAALGRKLYPDRPMEYGAPGSTAREGGV